MLKSRFYYILKKIFTFPFRDFNHLWELKFMNMFFQIHVRRTMPVMIASERLFKQSLFYRYALFARNVLISGL
jgi:hypothetical protein